VRYESRQRDAEKMNYHFTRRLDDPGGGHCLQLADKPRRCGCDAAALTASTDVTAPSFPQQQQPQDSLMLPAINTC